VQRGEVGSGTAREESRGAVHGGRREGLYLFVARRIPASHYEFLFIPENAWPIRAGVTVFPLGATWLGYLMRYLMDAILAF
jgi:hypothetical protein